MNEKLKFSCKDTAFFLEKVISVIRLILTDFVFINLVYFKILNESSVLPDFYFSKFLIYFRRFAEHIIAAGIDDEQVGHDDVTGHFNQTARLKIGIFRIFSIQHPVGGCFK